MFTQVESWKFDEEEKKAIAVRRSNELKEKISDYLLQKGSIKTGFDFRETFLFNKELILRYFNATEENWRDWRWQLSHRICDAVTLSDLFGFTLSQCEQIRRVGIRYRWAISPYYASLIDPINPADEIMLQSVPSIEEMDQTGQIDPMAEEFTSPAPSITRRYPDRLIINATNQCAMYCRHCQRRRNIGEVDRHQPYQNLQAALSYIRENREIRDVLITGGDALLLSDNKLDWLLGELDKIKHVEIKRLGTRAVVTLPQRITPQLCEVLKNHPPVYINTQFNHPREITPESRAACDMLVKAGVVMGNQTVLLKGVNNDSHIIKKLCQELLKIRVRPYYIFQAKPVKGTRHFITSVNEGLSIMEKLRGYTSGLAVPMYVINAPRGYGKIPVQPRYLVENEGSTVRLRTWENKIFKYSPLPVSYSDLPSKKALKS
ncbi:glutamate 2,3-aminomutase [Pelotomaculum propionicicum]|uniref:glutamate 2,3-aminomutase n=1 Tax=Pelotomaculum propionicicum TaxID=258475 RepID=UPI003B7F2B26